MSRSIPTSAQLEGYLGDIEDAIGKLRTAWAWAFPNAFSRPKHGASDRTSGGDNADVADEVSATERFRTLLRHAGREVVDARNRVMGAVADVNDAMALLDPPPGPEVADVRLLPHPADVGDLARAQAAQRRREARAVASGDYGEVTG